MSSYTMEYGGQPATPSPGERKKPSSRFRRDKFEIFANFLRFGCFFPQNKMVLVVGISSKNIASKRRCLNKPIV